MKERLTSTPKKELPRVERKAFFVDESRSILQGKVSFLNRFERGKSRRSKEAKEKEEGDERGNEEKKNKK